MKIRHMERGGGKNNVDTLNKRVYGSYEYVGEMPRKEGKIVVENVKKLMRKAMGIVLSVVLTLGCILGSGTIAWAEGETADAAAKIKVACLSLIHI